MANLGGMRRLERAPRFPPAAGEQEDPCQHGDVGQGAGVSGQHDQAAADAEQGHEVAGVEE